MRVGIVVGVALCSGVAIGFAAGMLYPRRLRLASSIDLSRAPLRVSPSGLPDSVLRARDPERWVRDSIAEARWRANPPGPMEEIWRVQAFNNCAVGFRIRDTTYGPHWLVGAEAREARTRMREPVSKGWTYTMSGFRRGDTVTIVLPNVFCGDITISSIEGSLSPPKPPIKLEVR